MAIDVYIMQPDGSKEAVKTKALYMNLYGNDESSTEDEEDEKDDLTPVNPNPNEPIPENQTTEDIDIEDEGIEIIDNLHYSYRFVGWDIDGERYDAYDKEVLLPEGGSTRVCTALFERNLTERNVDFEEKTIDESMRYTITSKVMYMVNCSIKYKQTYVDESADEVTKDFVLGVDNKYIPEVYTGD